MPIDRATRPHELHRTCTTHISWDLNCDEYDELRDFADNRCGYCGADDRLLNIDHDHERGFRAIRGLLCPQCNAGQMRRVDEGWRPIDDRMRSYLMRPWHLARQGKELDHDPAVHISINELGDRDRDELRRVSHGWIEVPKLRALAPRFEHPGIADCLAYRDLRPVLRLLRMDGWRRPEVDIADPAGPISRATALSLRITGRSA